MEKQNRRIAGLLALHKAIKQLTRDGVIYGIHRWGIHLTDAAFRELFGDMEGARMSKTVGGVEFFALNEGVTNG